MTLTLQQGQEILQAATAKAKEIGIAASIVVLDAAGHLKAFYRMDGAWLGSIDVAMKKAKTSVLFEMETQNVWEVCKPGAQAHGLEQTNEGLVTFAGGIPLKAAGGRLLGAVGVSGGQVSQGF
ncbi:MAG: heme-binding protein [Bradyrhizobium sp.]